MASTSMTVTVANGSGSVALVQYRSAYLTLDHAALVTAKRSRTDGADLYVTYGASTDAAIRRTVYVEGANTATARVWFSLAEGIGTSASDNNYTLHWGDLTASLPSVAAESYSQVNQRSGSETYHSDSRRRQPFAWFDDFKYDRSGGGGWVEITPGNALDITRYGSNGTWTYAAGGVVTAPLGTGDQFFKATADQSRTLQRVRALITLGSGSGASCRVGVLTSTNNSYSGATDLDGYGAGLRYSDGSEASLIEWANGTHTTLDNSAVAVQVGLETDVDLEVNPSAPTQAATVAVDTPNLSGTNGDHSAGYWGVYCDSTSGSGTFYCFRVMSMIWDGVADADITVSGTVPAISLPDCSAAFPVTETVMYPQAVDSFPDFLSPRSAAAVVGGYGERFDIGSFSVQWPFLTPTDYYEIIAFYEAKKGSSFSWTPPGGSARTVRIRPGSLETTQAAPQKYEVSMSLDKVPL